MALIFLSALAERLPKCPTEIYSFLMDPAHRVVEKHSLILRISHWLNVVFLSLMIWSGVLIAWADQTYYVIPSSIGPFQIHHRLAEGMGWHFFIMWPFVINGLLYCSYLFLSGKWRRANYPLPQKIAYMGTLIMGILTVLTGLAIYKPVQLGFLTSIFFGYEIARLFHFGFMVGFVFFIIVHVIQVMRAGWNNLRSMVAGFEIHES